jgi:hypothetical protein
VLVGQDLIKAAEIRATVSQIEKYNTAVNTFRGKFNGIPGDLSSASAAAFGFQARAGSAGRGDNNGLIDGTFASPAVWTQEAGMFWVDLSQANLIDGAFNNALDGAAPVYIGPASVPGTFPLARLARGNYVNVGSVSGLNYYMISGITATSGGFPAAIISTANLTPIEVYNMDSKLDDGAPLTGIVQVHGAAGTSPSTFIDAPTSAAVATKGTCLVGDTVGTDTTDTYNRSLTAGGNSQACMARFRFN